MSADIKAAIASATKSVTKGWKQAKHAADRNDRVSRNRIDRLRYRPSRVTIRAMAFRVMEDAYNKASSNGRYYANARQIMYAARPAILAECDASKFDSVYFTQTLLKDYLQTRQPAWRVVWDARGHLVEPYTKRKISLGGVGVKEYIGKWHSRIDRDVPEIESRIDTHGPRNRFQNVLFIEKEGFAEILTDAGIGERWDMAVMSTKGIPVDAACDLIRVMDQQDVRVFVLHDFDLSGFKILRTLRTGTRLSAGTDVIDLGLRMADIDGLLSEPVEYSQQSNPGTYLRFECGATKEEINFLVDGGYSRGWRGQRVEINAMTSEELIAFLERKFKEHGVEKVMPTTDVLSAAYKRAMFLRRMEEEIMKLEEEIWDDSDDSPVPKDLDSKVEAMMKKQREMSWDAAVWKLAERESQDGGADA